MKSTPAGDNGSGAKAASALVDVPMLFSLIA